MSLLNVVSARQLEARKNRDSFKATLLTTLLGESTAVGKKNGNRESTDAEVVKVIKVFIKNANDNAELWNHRNPASQEKRQAFLKEVELLTALLPEEKPQMADDVIERIIRNHFGQRDLMKKGVVMAFFKEQYAGEYDGKKVNVIFDQVLSTLP